MTETEANPRAARVLIMLAGAANHTPAAHHAVQGLLQANPDLLILAIRVARDGAGPIDRAIADAIESVDLDTDRVAALEQALPSQPTPDAAPHRRRRYPEHGSASSLRRRNAPTTCAKSESIWQQ